MLLILLTPQTSHNPHIVQSLYCLILRNVDDDILIIGTKLGTYTTSIVPNLPFFEIKVIFFSDLIYIYVFLYVQF